MISVLLQVRGTVFNEFHDENKIIKSIDFNEFEEQFKLGHKINDNLKRRETQQAQNHQQQQQSLQLGDMNDSSADISASNESPKNDSMTKRFNKQPERISFMEHNRLRNMAISLRKISLPTELLVRTVNRLEIDQLTLDSIEILLRMVPTPQEIKAYREYEDQRGSQALDCLTEEDKFLCQMSKIERLEQKIKIMFYMKNLEITSSSPQQQTATNSLSSSYSISSSNTDSGDLLAITKSKIEFVENASKSLRTSEGIRILLEYILVFGNYLNSSSRSLASAPAYGFKLQALDMVSEAKSTQDKSRNLLHFIVDTIMKNLNPKEKEKLAQLSPTPDSSNNSNIISRKATCGKKISPLGAFDSESIRMPYDFDTLMVELEQAANVSLETLLSEVKEFERGIELCIRELHIRCNAAELTLESTTLSIIDTGQASNNRPISPISASQTSQSNLAPDETIKRLQSFIKSRSCDIMEIKETIQIARKEFNDCAQYFGENPRLIESSSLFSVFLRHLKNFKQCLTDNKLVEKRKFDEELRKQIQRQQALRARKKAENAAQSQLDSSPRTASNSTNIVERSLDQFHRSSFNDNNNQTDDEDCTDLKENRLIHQDEVSHGTLDILITGLKVEPYRRADGSRRSVRRLR